MRFALVIIENDASRASIAADRAAHRGGLEKWMAEQAAAGNLLGGEAFETELTAPVTIRRDARSAPVVTEEPFAGPAETLGGYVLVEAENMAAAVELALTWPATGETVEVRPIWEAG